MMNMLKTALKMEEKGYKMYKQFSVKGDNSATRKVFNTLAKDETGHIKAIKKFYQQSLKPGLKLKLSGLLKERESAKERKKIFDVPAKKWQRDLSLSKSDEAAYKFALNFETKGYEFYKKSLGQTKEENARKLLLFLTEQENGHYRFLQETYDYLTKPANWFIKEEKPIYEGG